MQTEVVEKLYSASEYLAFEERAKNKHEYYNGKIRKTQSASIICNQIAANIISLLVHALYEKNFIVSTNDTKIYVPKIEAFVYPDALVVFEKPQLYKDRNDVIVNPLLIVEFLSRSDKFRYYKTLPSFKEYVLVEQAQPWILASYKIADSTWKDTEASTLDDSLYLASVDCTIDMKRVYHGIQFTKIQ